MSATVAVNKPPHSCIDSPTELLPLLRDTAVSTRCSYIATPEAMIYLKQREMQQPEVIEELAIGYAPGQLPVRLADDFGLRA